jgi:hypothetical protein
MKNGVNCDVRNLTVGDFAWIAREKIPIDPSKLYVQTDCILALIYCGHFIIDRDGIGCNHPCPVLGQLISVLHYDW